MWRVWVILLKQFINGNRSRHHRGPAGIPAACQSSSPGHTLSHTPFFYGILSSSSSSLSLMLWTLTYLHNTYSKTILSLSLRHCLNRRARCLCLEGNCRWKRARASGGVCAVSQSERTLAARAHMFTGDIPPVRPMSRENTNGFYGMEPFSCETGFTVLWGQNHLWNQHFRDWRRYLMY